MAKGNFLRSFLFPFSSNVLFVGWYFTLSPNAKKTTLYSTFQSFCGNLRLQEITSNILKAAHQEFPRFFRYSIPPIASFRDLIASLRFSITFGNTFLLPFFLQNSFYILRFALSMGVRCACPFFSCFEKSPPRRAKRTQTPVIAFLPDKK